MKHDTVGIEVFRDKIRAVFDKARDGGAIVVTRYGMPFAAVVPIEFLNLAEELDLFQVADVRSKKGFLNAGRCVKCGKRAPRGKSVHIFGDWHFPSCSRYRGKDE